MKATLVFLLSVISILASAQHVSQEMLKPLDFLVGEWTIEAHRRLAKNGPWDISKATATFQKVVGESVFEEHQVGTKDGKSLEVRTWLANDNRTKLYQRVSVDSDHGVLSLFQGDLKHDTLSLSTQLQLPDLTVFLRHRYIFVSKDKFVFESARSTDAGQTWDMTSRLTYNRVK
jgi:hypothetical protein